MSQAAGGVSSGGDGGRGDKRHGPTTAAATPTKDDGGGEVPNAAGDSPAAAPGDRFEPSNLLCLAAFHADNGAWADCLDVLDTAQEVWIVGTVYVCLYSSPYVC